MSRRHFDRYEFDLSTGELRHEGSVVPLERQPAVALTVLVSRAGRLVPRRDLIRALWPDDVHVDFDLGLKYCIRQLRAALGDDARAPRFIETIPRQGYRFIAAVDAGQTVPTPTARRSRMRSLAAAVAMTVLLAGVWESRLFGQRRNSHHHETAVKILRALHDVVF
jgi:DNA-binding winged helix-turn-helix (wHTH) protein